MKPISFYVGALGFFVGVVFGLLGFSGFAEVLWSVSISVSFFGLFVLAFVFKKTDLKIWSFVIFLFFLTSSFGLARVLLWESNNPTNLLDGYTSKEVVLVGEISEELDNRDTRTWTTLSVERIVFEDTFVDVKEEVGVRLALNRFAGISFDDKVEVTGKLLKPENFVTETGRTFDYISFLRKDNIYYQMWYPKIEVVRRAGFSVSGLMYEIKNSALSKIEGILEQPHASLLGGVLLGTKQALGDELEEKFRDTGLIHIVVLSGFNITVVAVFILWTFSFLPASIARILAIISIGLFAIMVGLGATVLRASLMAILAVFAGFIHRRYSIHRSLIIAGALMVLWNPSILLFDPSFQLSFVATAGLIYISPLLEKRLGFIPERFKIRETVSVTVAAQIAVLPLLIYMIGEVSLVSLPVNVLVIGFIPLTMFLGFVMIVFSFISFWIALPISVFVFIFLDYIFKVVYIFDSFPFSTVELPHIHWFFILLLYGLLAVFVARIWFRGDYTPGIFNSLERLK